MNIRKVIPERLHPLLEHGADYLHSSSVEDKERVHPYLYFSSEPSWPVIGCNLTLLYSTDSRYGIRKPLQRPQKHTSGPDPEPNKIIPNHPTLFPYYAFYYNPPIHAKFPE
jgi:hypothetical protein